MSHVVVAGTGGYVAKPLADKLGARLVEPEYKLFPDGEVYVRIPVRLDNSTAIIVQSLYPEQDRRFVELLLLAEAARGVGAERVIAVVPYMAYARQDKRFREGEPISIKVVLTALRSIEVDALVTVDIHKPEVLAYFNGPSINVDPSPVFAEALRGIENLVVIAPDRGALARAERLAARLGAPFDYLEKFRDRVTGEITMKPKEVNVEGKNVVIVDDIISTGGTLAKAAELLYKQGARSVVAAVSHALMVDGAAEKLAKAGVRRIIALNTVPPKPGVEVLDVSGVLAKAVEDIEAQLSA